MKSKLSQLLPQTIKNWFHWVVALIAVYYHRFPSKHLKVIGVTGTDGKTTTATMTYHFLKQSGYKVALISTVAAYIDTEEIDTGFHVTSPDPWQLQQLLSQIVSKGMDYVVLEATSHGLDQHRFYGVDFEVGILTNITHEHLDYHINMDNYIAAKSKLFHKSKVAVLNKSDKVFKQVKSHLRPDTLILDYSPKSINSKQKSAVKSKFEEAYNQLNASAALTLATYLGSDEKQLLKAVKNFPGVKGRLEEIENSQGFRTIVDFAHTPNALENVLKALKQQTKGKLIAVYGSAGLRDRDKRKLMGKIGSEIADEVVLTAEDPRTESVWSIIDEMASQIKQNLGHIHKIPDRQEAIDFAISIAQKGDIVAVLGKGHERSMCFGTIEYPWSDQEAIKKALKKS